MLRVGIVGWRGMVGSVLVQRMREERDFDHVEPVFFSTSQAGGKGPQIGREVGSVANANDIAALKALPVIISCQGGDYTSEVHPKLRQEGWKGYWIDAASALRMDKDAVIARFVTGLPSRFETASGDPRMNGVIITVDEHSGRHGSTPTARSTPRAFARVSSSSRSGIESATMPAPARTVSSEPPSCSVRIRIFMSMLPSRFR